ncbi:YbbR-like domain-containing protein [Balneola sp. MJW-20]|uniref:CdaR family protein n=1 Tax=Gracilimonas aurantiaca TaxID=3234185 RepID=UPI0034666ED9
MADNPFQSLKEALRELFGKVTGPGVEETQVKYARREKVIVFIAAYIMAISLWFIVNLNGNFSISIEMPVIIGDIPEDMALTKGLPESVNVEMTGDGWKLLGLYNDPPPVSIDVNQTEVNVFEQVRQSLSSEQDLSVTKVDPLIINISMEEKVSKKVPIIIESRITYRSRYGMIGEPRIVPDSMTITGARSQVSNIEDWVVSDTLILNDIDKDINTSIPITNKNPLVTISDEQLQYQADVSEFTEGESKVYISTRGLPRGQNVNYNPSMVTIKYDVPIEQYADVENINPFEAYVNYEQILIDSTGFVTPEIELIDDRFELRLRSFQPNSVAYFSVLDQ